MTRIRLQAQSPLTSLYRWQGRTDSAALLELLITGYTLDLTFVEQRAVSLARGMGARVTILGDANHGVHNPVDIAYAGRSYQHAHAGCRGAFHPKLVVLVGDHDVWVAIGSGNPTTAGWGYNEELWLLIDCPRESGPAAMQQLSNWLRALSEHPAVWLPSWIAATVWEIADMITPETVDESAPDLQILGNLDEPLLQQLPTGPVASLNLTAPFFDPRAAAARALIERMRPENVCIAVQPTLTSYDGACLVAAVQAAGRSDFRHLTEEGSRISHGKLIEWVNGEKITALIGSPNLSRAALMTATIDGGNCELAVIYGVAQSLVPEGVSVGAQEIDGRSTIPAVSQAPEAAVVTLLGARRTDTGITVELRATVAAKLIIELSTSAAPGEWWPKHQLEISDADAGTVVSAEFVAPESAGAAVRVVARAGEMRYVSSVVFLTDTARCLRRDAQSAAPRLSRDYTHTFTDPALLARFEHDLLTLLRANAAHRSARVHFTTSRSLSADENDRWGSWLNDVQTTLGPALTTGLFPTAAADSARPASTAWTVDTGDTTVAAAADAESEDDLDDESADDLSDRRNPPDIPAAQRHRFRQWAQRLRRAVTADPAPAVELRMLVTQLHLDLLAGGVWGPDDDWLGGFADVLTAMPPTEADDVPERGQPYLGALTAVGLALMSQNATLYGGRLEDLVLQRTWQAVGKWAADAQPDLIDHYLYQPAQTYSRVAGRDEVDAVITLARATLDDPYARLRAALESEGIEADLIDGAWVADCGSANPRGQAARIGTLIGAHTDTYAVVVRGDRGTSVLLCHKNTFAIAESGTRIWRVFTKRTALSTPTSMLADGLPSGTTFRRIPGGGAPDQVAALASAARIEVAYLDAALSRPN
jgi:hypothetical protein